MVLNSEKMTKEFGLHSGFSYVELRRKMDKVLEVQIHGRNQILVNNEMFIMGVRTRPFD